MDVSLDDIIKKNRMGRPNPRRGPQRSAQRQVPASARLKIRSANGVALKTQPPMVKKKAGVSDLRLLIGKKSKAPQVRDAREKLAPSRQVQSKPKIMDARQKLSRPKPTAPASIVSRTSVRPKYEPLPSRTLDNRPSTQSRKTGSAYMDLEEQRLKRSRLSGSGSMLLFRTVDNSRSTDIMDRDRWNEPSMLDLTRYQSITRTFSSDDNWRPPSMSSSLPSHSLARRPGSSLTSGVSAMAKPRLEQSNRIPQEVQGYRIVVSNLQPSVTHEDIKELFEDIGSLYSSTVVKQGTAEVVYKSLNDALKAVDTYHNRQLDGQPMKCLFVNPSKLRYEWKGEPRMPHSSPSLSLLPSLIPPLLPHSIY